MTTAPGNHNNASPVNNPLPDDVPAPADFKWATQSLLRYFFAALQTMASLLRRFAVLIVALAILGAALAWLYCNLVPPRYEYSMLLQCNGPSRTPFSQVIASLNSKARVDGGKPLAAATGMPLPSAEKMIWIRASFPESLAAFNDSMVVDVHRMLVRLRSKELNPPIALQTALLQTVNNTAYLRSTKEVEKAAVADELRFIDAQLRSLDSLHRSYTTAMGKGVASGTQKEGFDAAGTYIHGMELQREKGKLQTWLAERSEPAKLVVPLYMSDAPMRLLWWILSGAAMGAGLGLLIALLQWLKQWAQQD